MMVYLQITLNFYEKKSYFNSFIGFSLFTGCIYLGLINFIQILESSPESEISLLFLFTVDSKKDFITKAVVCGTLIFISGYFSLTSLRYALNYFILYYFFQRFQKLVSSYYFQRLNIRFQPITLICNIFTGAVILLFSQLFYFINNSYSSDLFSFIFISNILVLYYFQSIDKLCYIYFHDFIEIYYDYEKYNSKCISGDIKYDIFDELSQNYEERPIRYEASVEANHFSSLFTDILVILACVGLLFMGFFFQIYFLLLLSFILLKVICNYISLNYSNKVSKILVQILYCLFLLPISSFSSFSSSYFNDVYY